MFFYGKNHEPLSKAAPLFNTRLGTPHYFHTDIRIVLRFNHLLSWKRFSSMLFVAAGQANVMDYFSERSNPFYERTCNNEILKMQKLGVADVQLQNMQVGS